MQLVTKKDFEEKMNELALLLEGFHEIYQEEARPRIKKLEAAVESLEKALIGKPVGEKAKSKKVGKKPDKKK